MTARDAWHVIRNSHLSRFVNQRLNSYVRISATKQIFALQSRLEKGISLMGYRAGEACKKNCSITNTATAVNEGVCASTKRELL
jgi:hypothetical protein